jgi:hypothetical protein
VLPTVTFDADAAEDSDGDALADGDEDAGLGSPELLPEPHAAAETTMTPITTVVADRRPIPRWRAVSTALPDPVALNDKGFSFVWVDSTG